MSVICDLLVRYPWKRLLDKLILLGTCPTGQGIILWKSFLKKNRKEKLTIVILFIKVWSQKQCVNRYPRSCYWLSMRDCRTHLGMKFITFVQCTTFNFDIVAWIFQSFSYLFCWFFSPSFLIFYQPGRLGKILFHDLFPVIMC